MKKIFILVVVILSSVFVFQSCCPLQSEDNTNNGVIQFDTTKVLVSNGDGTQADSVDKIFVSSYDWRSVDTTGGFANIPTGIITEYQSANNEVEPLLNINETDFVKQMLIAFQKKFNVRVINYQSIKIHNQKQLYIRVFFERVKKENTFRSNF